MPPKLQFLIFEIMKPIDFPQSTKVLQRPETMTDAECTSLHVWNDGKQCISCWKPSAWERIKILFGQNLWLGVCSGKTQPPVFIAAEPVFEKAPAKDRIKEWFTDLWENLVAMFKSIISMSHEADKRKHFLAGFIIALVVGIFFPLVGVIAGLVAAFLKEWWDSKGHGTVELYDIIFTDLGTLVAFPLAFIIHNLIF